MHPWHHSHVGISLVWGSAIVQVHWGIWERVALLDPPGLRPLMLWSSTEAVTAGAVDSDEEQNDEVIGASNSCFDWQSSLAPMTSTSSSSLDAPPRYCTMREIKLPLLTTSSPMLTHVRCLRTLFILDMDGGDPDGDECLWAASLGSWCTARDLHLGGNSSWLRKERTAAAKCILKELQNRSQCVV